MATQPGGHTRSSLVRGRPLYGALGCLCCREALLRGCCVAVADSAAFGAAKLLVKLQGAVGWKAIATTGVKTKPANAEFF